MIVDKKFDFSEQV